MTATDTADPMLQKIVDALEEIRAEEFDYEKFSLPYGD
jgi:hypothetical protein